MYMQIVYDHGFIQPEKHPPAFVQPIDQHNVPHTEVGTFDALVTSYRPQIIGSSTFSGSLSQHISVYILSGMPGPAYFPRIDAIPPQSLGSLSIRESGTWRPMFTTP